MEDGIDTRKLMPEYIKIKRKYQDMKKKNLKIEDENLHLKKEL